MPRMISIMTQWELPCRCQESIPFLNRSHVGLTSPQVFSLPFLQISRFRQSACQLVGCPRDHERHCIDRDHTRAGTLCQVVCLFLEEIHFTARTLRVYVKPIRTTVESGRALLIKTDHGKMHQALTSPAPAEVKPSPMDIRKRMPQPGLNMEHVD